MIGSIWMLATSMRATSIALEHSPSSWNQLDGRSGSVRSEAALSSRARACKNRAMIPVQPVASDEKLPSSTDVVVIGGGMAGIAAAYALAKKDLSVAVLEKGVIAGEQSSRNWGWCRAQHRDLRE